MSGEFYLVLLNSLLLTAGAVFLYFGYRYYIAKYGGKPAPNKYVSLHTLEKGMAKGEIVFYFSVPEALHLKLEITNAEDAVVKIIEDREFEAGDHKINFDSTQFENGPYFYRIITPHQHTAKKFTIEN